MDTNKTWVREPCVERILKTLKGHPNLSAADLSATAFVSQTTLVSGYLLKLRRRKLLHISGWTMGKGRLSTPLYSIGSKDDVARPKLTDAVRDSPGMRKVVESLAMHGPMHYKELDIKCNLAANTLKNSNYLPSLLVQKKIHICGWYRSNQGPMSAIYALGSGNSVPKPTPFTPAQKSRRNRLRTVAARGHDEFGSMVAQMSLSQSQNSPNTLY